MQRETAFWRFSLAVYASAGVADECIALQDRHDLDVNVLLFCAWVGAANGVSMTQDDLRSIEATVGDWNAEVVKPLRLARRAMKNWPSAAALRERVKVLELDVEQTEQAMLFDVAQDRWGDATSAGRAETVARNLDVLLATVGRSAAEAAPLLTAAAVRYRP